MPTIRSDVRAKCPVCQTVSRFELSVPGDCVVTAGSRSQGIEYYQLYCATCAECKELIISLETLGPQPAAGVARRVLSSYVLWPRAYVRPVPEEVPSNIAKDYKEAAAVLQDSAKASAALSRRCLEYVLTETGGATGRNLFDKIESVMEGVPAYIAQDLDAVRVVGNFAAHTQKSEHSGEILDVEPGEAEWNLDVIDRLFEHYYVGPAISARKRQALNDKLSEAGKDPLREPKTQDDGA